VTGTEDQQQRLVEKPSEEKSPNLKNCGTVSKNLFLKEEGILKRAMQFSLG
jgi:hypothetical protein